MKLQALGHDNNISVLHERRVHCNTDLIVGACGESTVQYIRYKIREGIILIMLSSNGNGLKVQMGSFKKRYASFGFFSSCSSVLNSREV